MMNQFLITIIFLIPAANMQMSRVPQPYTGKIKICVQAGMCACVCVCVCKSVCESENALADDMLKGPGQAAVTRG